MKAERRIGEMRHEQASCFEDLRRMAGEFGLPCWTASQLNRGAFNKATPDMADVAEAFEKVAIADAIIGIGRTPEEAANKRSRLIMMGLRDEPSHQIIHLIDDRSRALWKTLEIAAASKTDRPKSDKDSLRDTILAKAKKRAKEGLGGD